jgi:uncharacterized protein YjbI with pentapeptide repeats
VIVYTDDPGHAQFTLSPATVGSLIADQPTALVTAFAGRGCDLSSDLSLSPRGASWALFDEGVAYTILRSQDSSGAWSISGSRPVAPAVLTDASLANAILTDANLYGVQGAGAQVYSSPRSAQLNGAILERASLNDANLGNTNLQNAHMLGINLSGASLINAQLNGAFLSPSNAAGGMQTSDLSHAHLQGAGFTDARLDMANLSGAEVAVDLSGPSVSVYGGDDPDGPPFGGVQLFTLDASTYEATFEQAASGYFQFGIRNEAKLEQLEAALSASQLKDVEPKFTAHGVTLSAAATSRSLPSSFGSVWMIEDPVAALSYVVWEGPSGTGRRALYASPDIGSLRMAFAAKDLTLVEQAFVTPGLQPRQWIVDNASEDPNNLALDYVVLEVRGAGSVLTVYGTAIHVEHVSADGTTSQISTVPCLATALPVGALSDDTVCPNGRTLATNKAGNWDPTQPALDPAWMAAPSRPRPPSCVPTDDSFCPHPAKASAALRRAEVSST